MEGKDDKREEAGEITRVWPASWQCSPPVPVGTILLPPSGEHARTAPYLHWTHIAALNTPLSHTTVTPCPPAPFIHSLCDDSNYTPHHTFCNYIDPNVYTSHKKDTHPRTGWVGGAAVSLCDAGFPDPATLYSSHVLACSAAYYFIKTSSRLWPDYRCNECGGKERWHLIYLRQFPHPGACHCVVGECIVCTFAWVWMLICGNYLLLC